MLVQTMKLIETQESTQNVNKIKMEIMELVEQRKTRLMNNNLKETILVKNSQSLRDS